MSTVLKTKCNRKESEGGAYFSIMHQPTKFSFLKKNLSRRGFYTVVLCGLNAGLLHFVLKMHSRLLAV